MKDRDLPLILDGSDPVTESQAIARSEAISDIYKALIADLESEIDKYSSDRDVLEGSVSGTASAELSVIGRDDTLSLKPKEVSSPSPTGGRDKHSTVPSSSYKKTEHGHLQLNIKDHLGTLAGPDLALVEPCIDDFRSLGCLIWKIYNPNKQEIDVKFIANIPGNLLSFYKSCLSKNPLKRPAISELQDCFMAYKSPPKPSNIIELNQKTKQVNPELSVNVGVRSTTEVEIVPEIVVGVGSCDVDELGVGCRGGDSVAAEVDGVQ